MPEELWQWLIVAGVWLVTGTPVVCTILYFYRRDGY